MSTPDCITAQGETDSMAQAFRRKVLDGKTFELGDKSYEHALHLLSSRRRITRPQTQWDSNKIESSSLKRIPGQHGEPQVKGTPSIVGMKGWLKLLGHSEDDINALNVIHVAGTKGKGSTCAFTESFLRTHGKRTGFPQKTGLYTSPHLRSVNERIRINFEPLSNAAFGRYFFEVYDKLGADGIEQTHGSPRYLQLLALVGFHAFIRERVDVAILETHHGGEFDATNVVEKPCVTAISSLGMDHVNQLGPTIENIAWHKGGILKKGVQALSAPQPDEAEAVLRRTAAEKGSRLDFVGVNDLLPTTEDLFQSEVQLINASLAIAASQAYLQERGTESLSQDDVRQGVECFLWPGRFQTISQGATMWFLDSAHNELSVDKAAKWFVRSSQRRSKQPAGRILIYSQISDQRDNEQVLRLLAKTLSEENARIDHVIFTTYDQAAMNRNAGNSAQASEGSFTPATLRKFCDIWAEHDTFAKISYEPLIDRALDLATGLNLESNSKHVLITGSQFLVGSALEILDPKDPPKSTVTSDQNEAVNTI